MLTQGKVLKILHTSDWHLGQNFMGKNRADEHRAFLKWLEKTIIDNQIDVLIVSGDIFDTGNPPNYALELYYNFLKQFINIPDFYIIITAGNHDSISTLKAPKELPKSFNIFIIVGEIDEDDLIPIYKNGSLSGVVCAVAFLRDNIVREFISGETITDKQNRYTLAIKQHYKDIYNRAKKLLSDQKLPIIATGHLTTVGSKASDSERDIYIGGSLDIDSSFLSKYFDYVALGHLHINQTVGVNHVKYSGSPIPLSFSEANQIKKVNIISFENNNIDIKTLDIPLTQILKVIKGNKDEIINKLQETDAQSWIEIHIKDDNTSSAILEIEKYAQESKLTILAIKRDNPIQLLRDKDMQLSLEELTPKDLFKKRLEFDNISDKDLIKQLEDAFELVYQEVLTDENP